MTTGGERSGAVRAGVLGQRDRGGKGQGSCALDQGVDLALREQIATKQARRTGYSLVARRKVSTTGWRSTSRRPHQPAASANSAPATPPASGTQGDAVHWNSKA